MGTSLQLRIDEAGRANFDLLPSILFTSVFPVIIGLLLGLPKLIVEIKEKKQWTFDWIKFTAIGIPSLYIIVMFIIPFLPVSNGSIKIPQIIIVGGPTIQIIAGIVFGYTLLGSLKK